MEFLFTEKPTTEDFDFKDDIFNSQSNGIKAEIFDNQASKCGTEFMTDDWSSNPDDFLDSIFSMNSDLLKEFDETKGFESLDEISEHIKKEVEDYEMSSHLDTGFNIIPGNNITPPNKLSPFINASVSSSSSDSGLSSDNLDIEMSPEYEPLSPTASSPGPSISERGEKNSPSKCGVFVNNLTLPTLKTDIKQMNTEIKPKVIVQRLPQVVTLPHNNNNNIVQPRRLNVTQGKEVKIVKLSPQLFTSQNNKKVTIQLKNSQTGARIQANPGSIFINNGNITEVKKLIRVQNGSNPRSILLPVSIQDVKDFKSIKIVNATNLKTQGTILNNVEIINQRQPKNMNIKNNVQMPKPRIDDSMSDHTSDGEGYAFEEYTDEYEDTVNYTTEKDKNTEEVPYPKLVLTTEEKRLLAKEGISLPPHYPLTKHEERELKRIRRKIRNKISAQDSRKRKKEYVDGLEERVKQCTEENQTLLKRIKLLQNQNQNLMSQMKKLQSMLSKGTNKTAQPTTCLMVLLLSLALVAAPNLKFGQNAKENELAEVVQETILQNRRNLLFDVKDQSSDLLDEEINMSDIMAMNEINEEREDTFNNESDGQPLCKKNRFLVDFDVDDQNYYHTKEIENIQQKPEQSFNNLASAFQQNVKKVQTSGFNIKEPDFLDKDVLEMISPTGNSLYELNLDKLQESIIDFGNKQVYKEKINNKLNMSELRDLKKY